MMAGELQGGENEKWVNPTDCVPGSTVNSPGRAVLCLSITHSLILSVFVLELRIMNPVTYTYQESALLFNYIPAPLPSF